MPYDKDRKEYSPRNRVIISESDEDMIVVELRRYNWPQFPGMYNEYKHQLYYLNVDDHFILRDLTVGFPCLQEPFGVAHDKNEAKNRLYQRARKAAEEYAKTDFLEQHSIEDLVGSKIPNIINTGCKERPSQ